MKLSLAYSLNINTVCLTPTYPTATCSMSSPSPIALFGLAPLPASAAALTPSTPTPPTFTAGSLTPPTSELAKRVAAYAKSHLPWQTLNHSYRVFAYGCAIARGCFPDWGLEKGGKLEETWFCTALLHDAGTVPGTLEGTALSYEFWAGVEALRLLPESGAETMQAESVAEAIFRHQDVQDKGLISLMTMLIQLGTLLDNVGAEARLVSKATVENVNREWGREGWSGCFEGTVRREKEVKPYAMVSRIEGFEEMIRGNEATGTKEG